MTRASNGPAVAGQPYTTLADLYQRARPAYPLAALESIASRMKEQEAPLTAVDVGCGTGIFTRLLAATLGSAVSVMGIEPNGAMREQAEAASLSHRNLSFQAGNAETLPFADGSLALITAATAAHWFDRSRFYSEVFRCLRRGGALAIVQNKRRWWDSPFLAEYEALHERHVPGYRRGLFPDHQGGYGPADFAYELAVMDEADEVERLAFPWNDHLTVEAFEALSLSSSISLHAIEAIGRRAFCADVRAIARRHADAAGILTLPYSTEVTIARAVRAGETTA